MTIDIDYRLMIGRTMNGDINERPNITLQLAPELPLPEKALYKYAGLISQLAEITASFVHGSGTAPTSFVINMLDLTALILNNLFLKCADDIDLVIPLTNADAIETKLLGISDWAAKKNLALNYAKSHHIVIRRLLSADPGSLETTSQLPKSTLSSAYMR